jgi:AcrR family transcriptional regulator
MSIPYEQTGRTAQKARTRAALIDATRGLLAEGTTPTVEQAADAARTSRTTAYRYFQNQRSLLLATYPGLEDESLLGPDPPDDPEQRLDRLLDELTAQIVEHEPQLRTMLRLSLDPEHADAEQLVFRRGRAIGWIEDALDPLRDRLPATELRRLALAIRTAVGIEALIWLTDIAGLSRAQAVDTMRWSAGALLRSALAEAP